MKVFKRWHALVIFSFAVFGHVHAPGIAEPKGAKMQFQKTSHDFGELADGTIVDYILKFTNVGGEVLRIKRVKGS